MFKDAIEAVKSYAASQNLTPAFGGVVDGQIGNNAIPPSYQQAIALQVSTCMHVMLRAKMWICAIPGLSCANPGSMVCGIIHGLTAQS